MCIHIQTGDNQMIKFIETYCGIDKPVLTKEELEEKLKSALKNEWHGEGQMESINSNLNNITNAFTSFIVSKALIGDKQAVAVLVNAVYDVKVADDN